MYRLRPYSPVPQKAQITHGCGMQVFGPYVTEWISSSQNALCQRCRHIEASTFATTAVDIKDAGESSYAPSSGQSLVFNSTCVWHRPVAIPFLVCLPAVDKLKRFCSQVWSKFKHPLPV